MRNGVRRVREDVARAILWVILFVGFEKKWTFGKRFACFPWLLD